eukprot:gene28922-32376_t
MSKFTRVAILGLALSPILMAHGAFAADTLFKATLSGTEEVPKTTSKGTGTLDATYDSVTKVLTWKGTYSGLSGAATAAHFHGPAPAGTNAAVELPLTAIASPFEGKATLTTAQ